MKTCFMVMGFGKKMDYKNSRMVNLDYTYEKVIKPLFEECFQAYILKRADELCYPGSIELDMYKQLLNADLVIADITTENANAIYELGIRHALRPASTIIIMQKGKESFPFDISHMRIITYENLEYDKFDSEKIKFKEELKSFIENIDDEKEKGPDSPVYLFLNNLCPPTIESAPSKSNDELDRQVSIANIVSNAQKFRSEKKYDEAAKCWESLHEMLPHYNYIIQQWALTRYKSNNPTEKEALEAGWEIINKLNPDKSLDIETLGISGAICKRMHKVTQDEIWLDKALNFYHKGYLIEGDYYNGENYANCLYRKSKLYPRSRDEVIAQEFERKKVCKEIIRFLTSKDVESCEAWELASLAVCSLHLEDEKSFMEYREGFLAKAEPWMRDTFEDTVMELKSILNYNA